MSVYYNENDRSAAAWLRELMKDRQIPQGDVDERSIEDVRPADLAGYRQCHFFAGIGGWSLALQLADWLGDRSVWTGSCPCQPFSAAGKRGGADDPRHLWPAWRWLIDQCRPELIFGEQVASKAGRAWFAGVQTDLEAMGYGAAAADLCAASIGAPHIRQRLWWVADYAQHGRREERANGGGVASGNGAQGRAPGLGAGSDDSGMGNTGSQRAGRNAGAIPGAEGSAPLRAIRDGAELAGADDPWADGRGAPCADGKQRRIKPGLEPLVDGLPRGVVPSSYQGMEINADATAEGRIMRLAGYGNAIVPQVAAEFVSAFLESALKGAA